MRYLKLMKTLIGIGIVFFLIQDGHAETGAAQKELSAEALGLEQKWGITVRNVRLTAAGRMVDFRYRVVDPDKAWTLLQKERKAYMVDQKTGKQLAVPTTKLGPLRQTAVKPTQNRDYIILFTNTGSIVKTGDKVTVVIGDFKAENLTVE
jgi:hypothetical protein